MYDTTAQKKKLNFEMSDVIEMNEVLDCEVFHDVIVADTSDGLWYCKKLQKKPMLMSEVPFYEALPWMVKRWKQVTGKGRSHENDQLEDARINALAKVEFEELHSTHSDYYAADFDEFMPGASSNEYHGHDFEL